MVKTRARRDPQADPARASTLSSLAGAGRARQVRPLPRWALVGLAGTPFLWLGMIVAISFVEAPLKFQAPGITVPLGLGIGRLVFRALNGLELASAAAVTALLWRARPAPRTVWAPLAGLWAVLAAQTLALRPVLDARAVQVIAGVGVPPAPWHVLYIALELVKAGLLVALGAASVTFVVGRAGGAGGA